MNFAGLGKLLHPETDQRSGTERFLSNLSTSNLGTATNSTVSDQGNNKLDSFSISTSISELLSPSCGMTEEEKKAYLSRIQTKLKRGEKLTAEEMRFLKAEDQELYMQASRVQNMRDSLEHQLKGCDSKADATKLFSQSMSMVSEKDPMKEYIAAAYQKVYDEFKQSGEYKSLPQTDEDSEKDPNAKKTN